MGKKEEGARMTKNGYIFMILGWGIIIVLAAFSMYKVLRKKR